MPLSLSHKNLHNLAIEASSAKGNGVNVRVLRNEGQKRSIDWSQIMSMR